MTERPVGGRGPDPRWRWRTDRHEMEVEVNPMKTIMCALACVAFVPWPVIGATQPSPRVDPERRTPAEVQSDYAAALAELETRYSHLPAEPEEDHSSLAAALNRAWALAGEWASLFLEEHGDASPEEVVAAVQRLTLPCLGPVQDCHRGYGLQATAVRLATTHALAAGPAYAITANYELFGTFFVVARKAQQPFRVMWNIKDVAARHRAAADELGFWASYDCYAGSGPLVGRALPLPADSSGHPRFYVDAEEVVGFGGTSAFQVSIWSWDGQQATPLFIHSYLSSLDTPGGVVFDGKLLRIATKEQWRTLWSCGQCNEPVGEWTVRITPQGVEDLGHRQLVPELELVDELYFRIERQEPADELAASPVIEQLAQAVDDWSEEQPPASAASEKKDDDDGLLMAMLMGWRVDHISTGSRLCLALLDGPGSYVYTMVRRDGRLFVTAVEEVNSLCGK
ncbi:MAG TPA: hypothetical protein VHR45_21295 [Thermoanaerobaculia bacterium]|nr:hypothetical protein [Thermoanaerobaculia bacterium]